MSIDYDEFSRIIGRIISGIQKESLRNLNIDDFYYWNINSKEVFDIYNIPQHLDIGKQSEDWEDLRRLLNEQETVNPSDLIKLSVILRLLGERFEITL